MMPWVASLILLLTFGLTTVHSYGVVMTSSQIAVGVGQSDFSLAVMRLTDGSSTVTAPPSPISAFDDIALDPSDETKIFVLSTKEPSICSYRLNETTLLLTLVNCIFSGSFSVSPYCGISAYNGTLIISGGTGGVSVFPYDTTDGTIASLSQINDQMFPGTVVGFPDVLLINKTIAAFSTDFNGSPRFGTMIGNIGDTSVKALRDFRVDNSLQFTLALGPANFPLVNCWYPLHATNTTMNMTSTFTSDQQGYLYTANGAVTVQNPWVTGSSIQFFTDLQAVACAVNTERRLLMVGTPNSILIYSLEQNPLAPILADTVSVNVRLTSVASSGDYIVYVGVNGGSILSHTIGTLTIHKSPPGSSGSSGKGGSGSIRWLGLTAPTTTTITTLFLWLLLAQVQDEWL